MTAQNRQPWDFQRFVQTLAYYERLPIINWIQKMLPTFTPPPPPNPQAGLIFDFRTAKTPLNQTWGSLDDVVMGGASTSRLRLQQQAALFSGNVTTANSGGFASVRTRNFEPPLNFASYAGLELLVKGDGQRYKFLLRDQQTWDSVAYAYSFNTVAQEWSRIRIPFGEMIPVFRAKTVPDAPALNTKQIRSLQLMLSKFEYNGQLNPHFQTGEFCLYIQSIGVY